MTLEPLADEHLPFEIELDSDPEVVRYLFAGPRSAEAVQEAHRRRTAVPVAAPGLGFWVGLLDGEPVGWWLLEPPERPDQGPFEGQAELGYRLLRRFWRQGVATEGGQALLNYAFTDLGLQRVFAETMAVNAGSRATMAKLGLTYVRTFHPDFDDPLPGTEQGEVEYAITRDQWRADRFRQ